MPCKIFFPFPKDNAFLFSNAALSTVSSALIILFFVTSIFAVISVHLFGDKDALNFGEPLLDFREVRAHLRRRRSM